MDRFPPHQREFMLETLEGLADIYLQAGIGTDADRDNVIRLRPKPRRRAHRA